ncbi:MAG TPA: hypothetical protein VGE72_19320 [Azospirillum sp.]
MSAHPLLASAEEPEWVPWRAVVWGLALERGRVPMPAQVRATWA